MRRKDLCFVVGVVTKVLEILCRLLNKFSISGHLPLWFIIYVNPNDKGGWMARAVLACLLAVRPHCEFFNHSFILFPHRQPTTLMTTLRKLTLIIIEEHSVYLPKNYYNIYYQYKLHVLTIFNEIQMNMEDMINTTFILFKLFKYIIIIECVV